MYKSNIMSEHNITRDQIEQILSVDFNGPVRSYKSYKIEGMKKITKDLVIIELIKIILSLADQDNNLDVEKTNFFSLGVAIKNGGFTLCLGSDQDVDIFVIYEKQFSVLIEKAANIFQRIYRQARRTTLN